MVLSLLVLLQVTVLCAQETVLSEVPGAGVGFREQFPLRTIYDIDFKLYNLTTPYAAERLGRLVRGLDVPLTGKKLGIPIYIVDGPGFYSTVEASPKGPILIHRRYLEKMVGMGIKSRSEASVNAAVRALLNSPAKCRKMESIIAHELGHQTQSHGRFRAGSGFAAAAQDKINFLRNRMNAISFYQKLQAETNRYCNDAYQRFYDAQHKPSNQVQYDADIFRLRQGLHEKGNLRQALSFFQHKHPTKVAGLGPSRTLRILNIAEYIQNHPHEFARYFDGKPLSLKVRQGSEMTISRGADGSISVSGREAVIDGFLPSRPSITSHIYEYMADEHSLLTRYLKSNDLRGSMALFNKLGSEPGKGVGLRDSHPSKGARILNVVSYVEANPQIFAKGLKNPIHFRVCRDLPAIKLEMVNGQVRVTGREAIVARLAKPEQLLFREYCKARSSYGKRVSGFINRRLLPKSRKYYATEPYVLEAFGKGRASGAPGKKWAEGKWYRPGDKVSRLCAERPARLSQQLVAAKAEQGKQTKRSHLRKAANGFSKTASTLFTIMLMNAAAQYHENGSVDMEAAIKHTLDSPEVWGGIAAAAIVDRSSRAFIAQKQLLTNQASRSMFSKALSATKGCLIAMVTFEVVGAYVREASKGVEAGDDGHLSITEMFSGRGERGKQFLKNLGKIMMNPKAHGQVLGTLLKDRLLTFEFGFTVAGMVAGAKAGAVGLGAAGALLGPVGATVMGVVGGIVGGIVGGLGGSIAGAWLDEKVNSMRYDSTISSIEGALAKSYQQKKKLEGYFAKSDKLRRKLVKVKTKKVLRTLGKLTKAQGSEKEDLEKEVKELRSEIQNLYLDELDSLAKVIDNEKMPLGAEFYINRENAVFSELVMSTSQVDDLINQKKGVASKETKSDGRIQVAPDFAGLSLG